MLNTVFKKFFNKTGSKETAKKRLQLALVYDRLAVSDDLLINLQNEIVDVISRYFIIDKKQLKLDITRQNDLSALVLNTPIISAKTRPRRA
jgi:cell division topological specificity factor